MDKFMMGNWRIIGRYIASAGFWAAAVLMVHAQGVLTVTPGRTVQTNVGTGMFGYAGDGGPATSATLASPSAIAYDANGNLFLADSLNQVVRKVSAGGTITTVAGTGVAGFGGDGASATQAYLDTPTGVAVDSSGNLYIADSHNHRIRKIAGGIITTIAGTGTAGFSGDGGAATSAQLSLPSSVTVDSAGNLYIADTNNQRIRKVTGATITTVAGDGEELYAGDGGAATAAALDSPTGVAVDSAGKIYIADRHNQRVRVVDASGNITTLAGSGAVTFAGGFSGDGANATAAMLSRPSGVSVDGAGNVYIADTNNQRIRQIGNGTIATVAGTGEQGFAGDGGLASVAILNVPKGVATDPVGNLIVADTSNDRVRGSNLPMLAFSSQSVGIASTSQTVTLANSGSAAITVSNIAFTGAFTTAAGGSCPEVPILLNAGASCTQNITYLPVASGVSKGSVVFSGAGVDPQSILLSGTAVQSTTSTTLVTSASPSFAGQPVTFTATIAAPGIATGSVTFYDGNLSIGTQSLASGSASIAITALSVGTHSITAVYGGDPNFTGSSSSVLLQVVQDFNVNIVSDPSNPGGSTNQTIVPGQTATFKFSVLPVAGLFNYPITLSVTGLPPGASAVFTPSTISLSSTGSSFTMVVTLANANALLGRKIPWGGGDVLVAVLLMPFIGPVRRRARGVKTFVVCLIAAMSLTALTTLSGCGTGNGFSGQAQKSYTLTLTGTATGPSGATLQHIATVTLTVQ
jgi:hypothetical protein